MLFLHSFWSDAFFTSRWGRDPDPKPDLFCFALSAHLIRQAGHEICLITDSAGAKLMGEFPYTEIRTDLEDMVYINPKFWTAGKVWSLGLYPQTKCVHIDGDVFLTGEKAFEKLTGDWDLVVQSKEIGAHFHNTYPSCFEELERWHGYYNFDFDKLRTYNFTYNTGIFGMREPHLSSFYHEYFIKLTALQGGKFEFHPVHDVNLVLEQSLLTYRAQHHNLKVTEMLPLAEMDVWGLSGAADRIGYTHLWGKTKYQPVWQEKVQHQVRAYDSKLWERISTLKF